MSSKIIGIDISEHNGILNWGNVKCDFAVIRGGFGNGDVDGAFYNNTNACPVPFGVYWFSYAYSVEKAVIEADKALATIAELKQKPTLPIFFDWEEDSNRYAKQNGVTVDKTLYSAMAKAFMDRILAAGYKAGNYFNHAQYKGFCTPEILNQDKYAKWYAYYGDDAAVTGAPNTDASVPCSIWQYTQKGAVPGFTGDLNLLYDTELLGKAPTATPPASTQPNPYSRVLGQGENKITNPYGNGHSGVDVVNGGQDANDIIGHSAGEIVFCQTGIPNDTGSSGNRSYGNCVKIQHSGGYATLYAHLDSVAVQLGQKVLQGQKIGMMGNTGNSYGTHLHFEVQTGGGTRTDPTPYLHADLPGSGGGVATAVKAQLWQSCNPQGQVTDLAAGVNSGSLWYQVHILGGDWLPKVQGCDIKDHENGYAGNGNTIDGLRVYYQTPQGQPYQQARYAVQTKESGWLPEQTDDSTANGMDGYAGNLGQAIIGVRLRVGIE